MRPSPRLLQRSPVWWAALLALAAPLAAAQDSCTPAWIPTFGGIPGVGGTVMSFAVFDDGSGGGPALYAGGGFEEAGAASAQGIARWDGESWSGLASGITGSVAAMVVFDDGSGPALYAGGSFTAAGGQPANRIVKWDGQDWSPLGSGLDGVVRALAVFDDGSGPALYAAGDFSSAGGGSANRIAKWDGMSWSALGSGMSGGVVTLVSALAVFDDGSGPALYAGGDFSTAGGQSASYIAKWDGQSWSALAGALNEKVISFAVYDDGGGPALYVGGWFQSAGGHTASGIAKWNGQSWSALSGGLTAAAEALAVFDDGSGGGPALFAGGEFIFAGGMSANRVAKWNGQTWSALGGGLNAPALALAVFDDGAASGPRLFAGGSFGAAGGLPVSGVAAWDGETWGVLEAGLNGAVYALVEFDDGSGGGPALYAAGQFSNAGGQLAAGLAKWNGQSWSPITSAISGPDLNKIHALAVFDDGSGDALYVGGSFTSIDGFQANNIAKWDGHSWSGLASGLGVFGVWAFTVFDDGSGPALYAGGDFTKAGELPVNNIAKWDGQAWSALSSGMNGRVASLAVFDDGSGPALYAGGYFASAGGQGANRIAKWDGAIWSALGSGLELGDQRVLALTVFDDGAGQGPALYVGGDFWLAGGVSATCIAKWDGQSWSALESGTSSTVNALAVFDDESGTGPALFVGGDFNTGDYNGIAKWNGQSWSALASGTSGTVNALAVFDDGAGTGPALAAGGWFAVDPVGDAWIAKWSCPAIESVPGCFGNPAALTSGSSAASIGETFLLKLSASQLSTGLGLVFFGLDGTDAAGCGLPVPGIGELLLALAPKPVQAASGALSASSVNFALGVPGLPSLVGAEIAFHGVALGVFDPGVPIELSNALRVTILQ